MMKLLLLILLTSHLLLGAEVLRVSNNLTMIAITHDLTRRWQVKDRVCVLQNNKEIDCGVVVKTKENFSIVKLKTGSSIIARGDKVILEARYQKPAELIQPESLQNNPITESSSFHLLSTGGSLGPGIFYPYLHLQRIVDPEFAIGVMPSYLNITTSSKKLSSISVLLTVAYFPEKFFKGFFAEVAAGLAFMSTSSGTLEQQAASFQSLVTGGYRIKTDFGVAFGGALGVQYLHDPEFSGLTLKGVGVKPIVVLDVGVNF